jgi:hypothetical protein
MTIHWREGEILMSISDFKPNETFMSPYWYERQVAGSKKSGQVEFEKVQGFRRRVFFANESGSPVRISIDDGGGRYLRHLAEIFPKEFARAIKSAGWALRKDLQEDIYRGGPGEARWMPLSGPHAGKVFDDAKPVKPNVPRTHPMGQLVRAIGYRYDAASQSVRVGWLSHSAAKRGAELQRGFRTRVTKKMRRFFWAIGVPLAKGTTMIETPERPLFDVVLRHRERAIQRYIENKVHDSVRKSNRFAWAR